MTFKDKISGNNIVTPVAILLFIGTVSYLAVEMGRNGQLRDRLTNERLTSESLLSEKLLLEKRVLDVKSEYKSLREKNYDLERTLSATTQKLDQVSQELQNSQNRIALSSQLKDQNKKLMAQNELLEKQFADQTISLNQLQSSKDNLELSITLLQEQNKSLAEELTPRRHLTMSEILIEPTKKNGKLTVNAKRTKRIVVNVDIPSNAENLNFKVTNPLGKEVKNGEVNFVSNISAKNNSQPKAFYVANSLFSEITYNRVQMVYSPQGKLMAGLYMIEILSDNRSIGSLQVKLR